MPRPRDIPDSAARRKRDRKRQRDYDERWQIASALIDGPRTFDQLLEYFRAMARRFGLFYDISGGARRERAREKVTDFLRTSIARIESDHWVERDGDCYALTDLGRTEAEAFLSDVRRGGAVVGRLTKPSTVSGITMGVHFALALAKLPVAIISGSVGLLNDAIDTLVDGISSLLVFFGVRRGRERLVSGILVALMGVTGVLTAVEAIARLVTGSIPSADPGVFVAVLVSGLICAGLYYYQRYVGLAQKCVPLIAQSVDSRNHVLVAVGVTIDLIAARMGVPYVDGAVGLVVSGLILKGSIELLLDLVRSGKEGEPDLSSYGFAIQRHRAHALSHWLLLKVDEGEIETEEDLEREAASSLDFSHIATYEALGIAEPQGRDQTVKAALEHVHDGLIEGSPFRLTPDGRAELNTALSHQFLSGRGRLTRLLVGAVKHGVSAVFLLSMEVLFAYGARWVISLLPGAPLIASTVPIATVVGLSLTAVDLWFAGAGAAVFLIGRIWTTAARREKPFKEGRRLRPVAARIASGLSLFLLINSWWALTFVGIGLIGRLLEWLYRRRRRQPVGNGESR